MVQIIGYTALSLNLISMSMKNILYLRVCSLLANAVYVVYGIMLDTPPVFIGCAIGTFLHSYWIYRILNEQSEQKNKNSR
jgi:hypothetical protein